MALAGAEPTAADMVNQLEAKVNSLPPSARPALPTDESDMPSDMRLGSNATASTSSDVLDNTRSFSDSEDSELAWALNRRISQIATSAMSPEGMENENSQDMDEPEEQEPEVEPLTGGQQGGCTNRTLHQGYRHTTC